jgi:glucosamine--fructose-6-phosphate aminotransferase (isomerizing)
MNRMMRDIQGQPESLSRVIEHQFGAGRRTMTAAADALREARNIVITGMGASLFAATPLFYSLRANRRDVQLMEAGELLHYGGGIGSETTVVVVSRSGETVEAVRLLPVLRTAGARVLAIVNESDTTLAREADLTLEVNSARDEIVAVQTYTGTVLATLLLGAAVTGEESQAGAHEAVEAVKREIARWQSDSELWPAFLGGAPVVYVLGRGPSYGSAQEGALLFHETAKLPAVAMACAGFRHGPVEAVDSAFRAIVFVSQRKTLDLDQTLASQIVRMGGQAQTIAVEPGVFAPVVEIVPLQFGAYHAAVLRGFEPGRFRHGSLITASETDFGPASPGAVPDAVAEAGLPSSREM